MNKTHTSVQPKNLFSIIVLVSVVLNTTGCFGGGSSSASPTPTSTDSTSPTAAATTTPAATSQTDDTSTPTPSTSGTDAPNLTGPSASATQREIAESIDEFSMRTIMEHLTGVVDAPLSTGPMKIAERGGSAGRAYAQQYIKEIFESYGIAANYHEFTSSAGRKGKNVEGVIPGSEGGGHIYVTAHLDSVSNAGANDDASGVAAMLLAARALRNTQPKDTIHFVGFDLEEIGLVGSFYYVRDRVLPIFNSDSSKVIGNIQMDMIGHNDGKRRAVFADCGEANVLLRALQDSANELRVALAHDDGCAGRSDHERFKDQGIPGLIVLDDFYYGNYPWYHEPTDTIDKVDMNYLTEMSRTVAIAAARLSIGREIPLE